MLKLLAVIYMTVATAGAGEVPAYIIDSALRVESSSWLNSDGSIHWQDRRRGDHGHRRGPFQCGRKAFRDVAHRGENYADLETNMTLARAIYCRYLLRYRKPGESWIATACRWQSGPGVPADPEYRRRLEQ